MNRTSRYKQFAVTISFTVAVLIAGCSNNDATPPQTPPAATTMPTDQSNVAVDDNEVGAPTGAVETPNAESDNLNKPTAKTSNTHKGESQRTESGDKPAAITVGSLVELAKTGKVPGSTYAAHTSLYDDIEKDWGVADKKVAAGKGIYVDYKDKGITFGYNKGLIVFDVRSYSKKIQTLKLTDIEKSLGKADSSSVNGSDKIYTYDVNNQFQLKFIIAKSTNKVDHISVFSPQDAKNNMAG